MNPSILMIPWNRLSFYLILYYKQAAAQPNQKPDGLAFPLGSKSPRKAAWWTFLDRYPK